MHVLTAIICVDGTTDFDAALPALNAWAVERSPRAQGFHRLNEGFVGKTAPQTDFYGTASNYLDQGELVEYLRALPWHEHDVVQLVVNCEHDDGVRLVNVVGVPRAGCCTQWEKKRA